MTTFVSQLRTFPLPPETPVYRLGPPAHERVRLDDPASKVMTDLRRVRAVTIAPEDTIDFALRVMVHAEVRLLVVTDASNRLLGLITARDIMGERPINFSNRERVPHEKIQVQQIMTPRAEINPLDMRDVERTRVRDVVLVLREAGRQHALVVEREDSADRYLLRGIFSITQIGRQLGVDIEPGGAVQSFAEFERLLLHEREVA